MLIKKKESVLLFHPLFINGRFTSLLLFPKMGITLYSQIKDIVLLFKTVRTYYGRKVYTFTIKTEILYQKDFKLQAVHSTKPPS